MEIFRWSPCFIQTYFSASRVNRQMYPISWTVTWDHTDKVPLYVFQGICTVLYSTGLHYARLTRVAVPIPTPWCTNVQDVGPLWSRCWARVLVGITSEYVWPSGLDHCLITPGSSGKNTGFITLHSNLFQNVTVYYVNVVGCIAWKKSHEAIIKFIHFSLRQHCDIFAV